MDDDITIETYDSEIWICNLQTPMRALYLHGAANLKDPVYVYK